MTDKTKLLLSILMNNRMEDRGLISTTPDDPMIISEAMIKRMDEDPVFCNKMQGWKWETLWTTKAVEAMLKDQKS